jgi:N utilization substance protein B
MPAPSNDPRHQRRVKLMQHLFAYTFDKDIEQYFNRDEEQYYLQQVKRIVAQLDQLDPVLQEHAPERPLAQINQVDLAILRLILWEHQQYRTPRKVLIDEAVELAKEFGSESSSGFVNAVLGKILLPKQENHSQNLNQDPKAKIEPDKSPDKS